MSRTFIFATSAVALLTITSALAAEGEPSAKRGRETFIRVGCSQCHGTEGQGSNAGLPLVPDPLPAEAIAQFIRGNPATMPPYREEILSDAEIADIAAYLQTIPPPPKADDIAILKNLSR